MKQTFSEEQNKSYQEYFDMLENSLNKDKPKPKEPEKNEKSSTTAPQNSEPEEKQVAKKFKPGKMLNMVLGGALTAIGGISLFWLFRNKNKFTI
jgi:hypothetical protein